MATEYIKHNEFVRIAIECESNINLMTEYIRTNIHPNADKKQVAQRLATYRRKGHLPLDSGNAVSIGEVLKGTSTLYDDTGNIVQQWIKTDVDKTAQLEAFENAVNNICERVIPIAPFKRSKTKDGKNCPTKTPAVAIRDKNTIVDNKQPPANHFIAC